MSSAVDAIAGGNGPRTHSYGDDRREPVGDPTADDDGDGLTNEEEAALGTDPSEADSDGDGMSDTDEFEHGTDPTQGIEPLTAENAVQAVGAARDQRGRVERPRGVDPRRDQPRRLEELPARRRGREHLLDENGELVLVPPGATVDVRGREAEGLPADGERGRRRPRQGPGQDPRRGRQEREHRAEERAGEAVAQPPRPAGELGPAQGRRGRGRDREGRCRASSPAAGSPTSRSTPPSSATGRRSSTSRGPATCQPATGSRPSAHNGDKLFYDSARNEFAVLKPDGILRTYFRPKDGPAYWLEQIAKG